VINRRVLALIILPSMVAAMVLALTIGLIGPNNPDDETAGMAVASTVTTIIPSGLFAIACLREWDAPQTKWTARFGLCIASAAFVFCLIGAVGVPSVIYLGEPLGLLPAGWFMVAMYLIYMPGFLIACALLGAGTDRRHWRWIGVVCAWAAFVAFIISVGSGTWMATRAYWILLITAWLIGYANFMLSLSLMPGEKWFAYFAIVMEGITCYLWCRANMIWNPRRVYVIVDPIDLVPLCAILAALATLCAASMSRWNNRAGLATNFVIQPRALQDSEPA
jgi:hypothetical protein